MDLMLTEHARRQADRRGIALETVLSVATNPEQVIRVSANRKIRQSRGVIDSSEKEYLVRVVIVRHESDRAVIVTVYRTSKIERYWRNG